MVEPELGNGGWFISAIVAQVIEKVQLCSAYYEEKLKVLGVLPETSADWGTSHYLLDLKIALKRVQDRAAQRIGEPCVRHWLSRVKDAVYEVDDALDNFEALHHFYDMESDKRWPPDMKSGIPSSSRSSLQRAAISVAQQVSLLPIRSLEHYKDLFLQKEVQFESTILLDAYPLGLKKILDKLNKIGFGVSARPACISVKQHTTSETCSLRKEMVFGRDGEKQTILDMLLASKKPESSEIVNASDREPSSLRVLPIVGIGGVGKTTLAQLIFNDKKVAWHFNLRHWIYIPSAISVKRILQELVEQHLFSRDNLEQLRDNLEELKRTVRAYLKNQMFLIVLDHVCDVEPYQWGELCDILACGAKGSMVLVTTQSKMVAEKMGSMEPIVLDVLLGDDLWNLFKHCAFHDTNLDKERMETLQQIGRKINVKLHYAFHDPTLDKERMETLQQIGRRIVVKLHGLPLLAKAVGSLLRLHLSEDYWNEMLRCDWWELGPVLNVILPSLGLSFQHLESNLKLCFAYCSLFPKVYIFKKEKLVQMWIAQGFIQPHSKKEKRIEDIGDQYFDELISQSFFRQAQSNDFIMDDLMRELAVFVSSDECCMVNDDLENIPLTVSHLTINKYVIKDLHLCGNLRTLLSFGHDCAASWCLAPKEMFEHLRGLRVLDLSHNSTVADKFLGMIGYLSHLRYLDLSHTSIGQLPKSICQLRHLQVLNLENCSKAELPADMNKMISIRHLYAEADAISSIVGIGKLTNLQELNEFRVERKAGHGISELRDLKELHGRLCLLNLENVEKKEEAIMAKLKDKKHLRGLQLQGVQFMQEILEGLQPHPNLEKLEISGYADSEPPSWLENDNLLTSLKELKFDNCPHLERLPANLTSFTSLSKLEIVSSPKLKERYQKEPQGADWPKIAHISIDNKIVQVLREEKSAHG